jgi:hypothetical protein
MSAKPVRRSGAYSELLNNYFPRAWCGNMRSGEVLEFSHIVHVSDIHTAHMTEKPQACPQNTMSCGSKQEAGNHRTFPLIFNILYIHPTNIKQDRQRMYNVTLRWIPVNTLAVENKKVLHILSVCV